MGGAPGSRRWIRAGGAAGLVLVTIAWATSRAASQGIGTDFHVFWQAGTDFSQGRPLYHPLPGARRFLYPPFAAQLFQVLALFPLKTAAWLFQVTNVLLIVLAAHLTIRIAQRLEPGKQRIWPLLMALATTAVFVLDNLVHVQVNLLTFVLCLLGVDAFVTRREPGAAAWLVTATALKITPVFFLVWIAVRGRLRTLAAIGTFGAVALALPIAQRGAGRGVADLAEYYQSFLQEFASGRVITVFRNQNLAAMIYRAVVPEVSGDVLPYDYAYLPSLAPAAPAIYRGAALAVLGVLLVFLFRRGRRRERVSVLEICSVFLVGHLLSGITWKAHLVSLLFVSYVFFSMDAREVQSGWRWALPAAWSGLILIGLGRDVLGSRLFHYMAGYSIYVWVMLFLLALCLWFSRPSVRTEPCSTSAPDSPWPSG